MVYLCVQDFHSLATYLSQNSSSSSFLDIVSDFHLLIFLVTNEVMPLRVSIANYMHTFSNMQYVRLLNVSLNF